MTADTAGEPAVTVATSRGRPEERRARRDLDHLVGWVPMGAQVLDLGCGDGSLLLRLEAERDVQGLGLEINPDNISHCLEAGLQVVEQDLDRGLANFCDSSFDVVVMTYTLQEVARPLRLIDEMLRVGQRGIVSFRNYAHWRSRWDTLRGGPLPGAEPLATTSGVETEQYAVRPWTVADFEQLCRERQIRVVGRYMLNAAGVESTAARHCPKLCAHTVMYHFSR